MKKTGKLVIIFLISLLFNNMNIYAQFTGTAEVVPQQIQAKKGEEFAIEIKLTCNNIEGDNLLTTTKVEYNKDILKYEKVEGTGDRIVEASMFEEIGEIYTDGKIESGECQTLCKIYFSVLEKEKLPSHTSLKISGFKVTDGGEDVIYTNMEDKVVNIEIINEEQNENENKVDENTTKENIVKNEVVEENNTLKEDNNIIEEVTKSNEKNNDEEEIPITGRNYFIEYLTILLIILFILLLIIIKKQSIYK